MICRECGECGESNYSRVRKTKLENIIFFKFPIKAYVCNICGNRTYNKGFYFFLLSTVTFVLVIISIYGHTLSGNNQLRANVEIDKSTNLTNSDSDVDGVMVDDEVTQDTYNPLMAYGSDEAEHIAVIDIKRKQSKNQQKGGHAVAETKNIEENRVDVSQMQTDKETQNISSVSIAYNEMLGTSDSLRNLDLKQCFENKRVILFNHDIFSFYDNDNLEDKISIQKSRILVYLSISGVGITETAHYEYAIPDEYSGSSHYFVFLDRDEDGLIDNKIYAYPKDREFPINLCKSTSEVISEKIDSCPNINHGNPFMFEFNSEIEHGIDWVLSQQKNNYTIQLYAALDLLEADNFIRKYNLKDKAIVFPALVNEKTYFKVVIGNYADIKEAKRIISILPERIQILKPWIRKFSTYYLEISMLPTTICS